MHSSGSREPGRLYTGAEVAALLGLHISQVRRLARTLGVGRTLTPRMRVFGEADVAVLRQRRGRGRPRTPATRPSHPDTGACQ